MRDRLIKTFKLLTGLGALASYVWFTLMVDNHSFMVAFPWVYWVQLGFLGAVLWSIIQIWVQPHQRQPGLHWLGGGLDWVMWVVVAALSLSLTLSDFPQMAFLYTLIACAYLGILYGLHHHLADRQGLLLKQPLVIIQGLLACAFIVTSLGFWLKQTVFPELAEIARLKAVGIAASYNFASVSLRNWATFGHPNYVAGYLLLALPLLLSLAIAATTKLRWFWGAGFMVGLLAFYATNSRGGWLGLFTASIAVIVLLLWKSQWSRRWVSLWGCASVTVLLIWALSNDRLRQTFTGILNLSEQGGAFAYRWITVYTGWQMGWHKPLTGLGLGSVPILYQEFRPHWAGQEAESLFQLHSTPIQIWAELGLLGIFALCVGLILLARMWWRLFTPRIWQAIAPEDRILVYAIGAAGIGYGTMAITDYQLDVPSITLSLLVYLSLLTTLYHRYVSPSQRLKDNFQPLALGLVGLTLVGALLWLIPMNQAWAFSHRGFQALRHEDAEGFVENLTQAHHKAPWQPYYAYQLGWTLGEFSRWDKNPQSHQKLTQQAIYWFEQAIAASPSYDFGQSNLAWLLLDYDPQAATRHFSRALDLVPYRHLGLSSLGQGWLIQGNRTKAIEAIALEFVRFPETIVSPQWVQPQWQPYYIDILRRSEQIFSELIEQPKLNDAALQTWLHQSRGALRWYFGDDPGALADFQAIHDPFGELLVALESANPATWRQNLSPEQVEFLEQGIKSKQAWALAIAAWFESDQRHSYLDKAWTMTGQAPDDEIRATLMRTLDEALGYRDWIRIQPPNRSSRVNRIGFSVIARHMGGNKPKDYAVTMENIPAKYFLKNSFTSLHYEPALDIALESYWQPLLAQ